MHAATGGSGGGGGVKACLLASSLVWRDGNECGPRSDTSFRRPQNLTHSCGSLCVYNRKALRLAGGSGNHP